MGVPNSTWVSRATIRTQHLKFYTTVQRTAASLRFAISPRTRSSQIVRAVFRSEVPTSRSCPRPSPSHTSVPSTLSSEYRESFLFRDSAGFFSCSLRKQQQPRFGVGLMLVSRFRRVVGPDIHHTFEPMIDCNCYFWEWKDPWRSDEFGDSGSFQFR